MLVSPLSHAPHRAAPQARLTLRDDDHSGAPPRTGIDPDAGTARIARPR
ncbi:MULTISPECIES: DUF6191 domain-containing protein [Kitasatospora]